MTQQSKYEFIVKMLFTRLNALSTRYKQKGFKFEASEHNYNIDVKIQSDKYVLHYRKPMYKASLAEDGKQLIDYFTNFTTKLYTFDKFLTSLQQNGFQTQPLCLLQINLAESETKIVCNIIKNQHKIRVTLGLDGELAFIDSIKLFSSLGEDTSSYTLTIPGTSIKLSVDGTAEAYNDLYVIDEKQFPYGSTNNQVISVITKFTNTIEQLNIE